MINNVLGTNKICPWKRYPVCSWEQKLNGKMENVSEHGISIFGKSKF